MHSLFVALAVITAAPLLFARPCAAHGDHHHGSADAKTEARAAGVTGLDVAVDGERLDLVVARDPGHGGELMLEHVRSTDGGATFSAPRRIGVPGMKVFPARRGFEPRIAARGDRLLVVWTAPGTSEWGDGPLQAARSLDGGRTWAAARSPADDGSTLGHGFASLAVDGAGTVHAVWLDARDGGQGLRYARSEDFGQSWSRNATLESHTCECCWNSLYASGAGKLRALYRKADPRDMALEVSDDGGRAWRTESTVGAFGWKFKGCPHEGGALATAGDGTDAKLFAAVWTGAEGKQGIHVLASGDGGKTWGAPQALGDRGAEHPDIAADDGAIVTAWDALRDGRRTILASRSRDGGAHWEPAVALPVRAGARASHPRIVRAGKRFTVLWTELAAGGATEWRHAPLP